MTNLQQLEREIRTLKARNRKVESDKAWEISYFRRTMLIIFTYIAIGAYLQVIEIPDPWLNAIVPAVAFMLSTLTLPFFKELWLKRIRKS